MHQLPRKTTIATLAALAGLSASLAALAQQTANPPATPRAAETALRAKVTPLTELDRYLVSRLVSFTQGEISLGRLAQEQASRRDVRLLAAELVQDHAGMQTLMQDALATNKPPTNKPTPFQPPTDNSAPATTASPPGNSADRHETAATFLRLSDDVNRNFQQSVRRELSAQQGPQFDAAFLQSQISAQLWLLDALAAFERNASADLKPLLQRWIQIAEYDLNQARRLDMWIARVGPNGPPASGIFGPRMGAATSGSAVGTMMTPRPRIGLSPLPTTTRSPTGKTVGPAQGSP